MQIYTAALNSPEAGYIICKEIWCSPKTEVYFQAESERDNGSGLKYLQSLILNIMAVRLESYSNVKKSVDLTVGK